MLYNEGEKKPGPRQGDEAVRRAYMKKFLVVLLVIVLVAVIGLESYVLFFHAHAQP